MAGHKTWAVGEEVIQTDFQGYVADEVNAIYPNAAARTAGWAAPITGAISTLTDRLRTLWMWDGTTWLPLDGPRGEVGYKSHTAAVGIPGTLSPVPAFDQVVAVKAGRLYRVTFDGRLNQGAVGFSEVSIYVDSTILNIITFQTQAAPTSTVQMHGTARYAPSVNASVTFGIRVVTNAAATTLAGGATQPLQLYSEDIGPATVVP